MKWRQTLTEAQQSQIFSRRNFVISAAQWGVGGLLAARMGWIAIAENDKYATLAESNRVNLTLIPPRRGWIIDRYGTPIANNRTDFRVDIIPDRLRDKDRVIGTLADLLGLTSGDVERINEQLETAAGFQPVQVADGLDYQQYAAVSVRLVELPGVAPAQGYSRNYPAGPSVGHLIGYVGPASAEEYKARKDPLLITPGYKIGKDGLEKSFDRVLTGTPGAKRVEVTAGGKVVRELTTRSDKPGQSIRLTIDAGLQEYAGRRLGLESGSVVVIDCTNGDILALASMPSFDPNSFSDGISHAEWQMLSQNDHVPLRNKTLQGLYPPGSTVKPMVALAFLEAGLRPDETVQCRGGLRVGNRVFHCWNRRGHGTVDMAKGIYQSCDVYFYHFAQRIGMNAIAAMARKLGMGERFPLPFPSQYFGTVPDPAWKLRKYDKEWQTYDTVNATIGQGYMLANPLQLAIMSSRIASGRALMPNLVMRPRTPPVASLGISQEHLDYVHAAMSEVVNGAGTAGRARLPIPEIKMAGKTGTAQVVGLNVGRGGKNVPWKFRDHGLFICYAPFDKPRFAAAVVIEHGAGSSSAYPIARDVMTYLFDRQKALDVLAPMEEAWGGRPEARMAKDMAAFRIAQGLDAAPVVAPPDNASAATNTADQPAERSLVASPAPAPLEDSATNATEAEDDVR